MEEETYSPTVKLESIMLNAFIDIMIRVHVDDLRISSGSMKQLEDTVDQLSKVYGEITVHQGDEHDYLGMVLKYELEKRIIAFNMRNYIQGVLEKVTQDNDDEDIKVIKLQQMIIYFK
jgi:hypothetical protein